MSGETAEKEYQNIKKCVLQVAKEALRYLEARKRNKKNYKQQEEDLPNMVSHERFGKT